MKKTRFFLLLVCCFIANFMYAQTTASVTCGTTLAQNYCYGNNDNSTYLYTSSDGVSPLIFNFLAGGIESCCDDIIIYDGIDVTAPILTTITGVSDLTGITVSSTGPNIFMALDSDSSVSCSSGSTCCGTAWDWTVDCLSCQFPEATATVNQDCTSGVFTIDVNITGLGNSTSLSIVDGAGTTLEAGITAPGLFNIGPFPNNTPVNITVKHENDAVCDQTFENLVNASGCVTCGTTLTQSYCYVDNDANTFTYVSSDGISPLILTFNSGGIESCCDDILIYDGANETGTLLTTITGVSDLSGITVSSTTPNIHIVIDSDGSVSCGSGSACCGTTWDWTVDCLNCQPLQATTTVVEDCINGYTIDVNITSIGDAGSIDITDGTTILQGGITATGVITIGPFVNNTPTNIIVEHDTDPVCSLTFNSLVNTTNCPVNTIIDCGTTLNQNYCYGENETQTFLYTSSNGSPLLMNWAAGTLETCCDDITIYDGTTATAPVLYTGTGDLAGLSFTSTTPSIFVVVDSDGSVSCASGSQTAWDWTLDCLDCMFPVATATVVEDCDLGFTINLNITSIGDATTLDVLNGTTVIQSGVGVGAITLGPFLNNSIVNLVLAHDTDAVCNLNMPNLTNPTICHVIEDVACGNTLNQSYCYKDDDQLTWLYTATNPTATLTLTFNTGGIENNTDVIILYDGTDNTGTVLYNGSNAGNLAGLTVNSTGPNIFMDVTSNSTNSCASGNNCCETSWNWDLVCVGGCDFPQGMASYDCVSNEISLNVSNVGLPEGTYSASIDGMGTSNLLNTTGEYPSFGPFTSDQTYNVVFDDGAGCSTSIPFIYGACRMAGSNCSSDLSNGDFEQGVNGWTQTIVGTGNINAQNEPIVGPYLPLRGTNSARLGNTGGMPTQTTAPYISTLSRSFFGTTGETITLYYWLLMDGCAPSDEFVLTVDGNPVTTLNSASTVCGEGKWREYAIDLSAYADNNTHDIVFTLTENETNGTATRVYIDDILLEGCEPFVCPPAFGGLAGVAPDMADYETDGSILSIQTIAAGTTVDYDAGTEINLGIVGATFTVELGATFCAFIDGCNGEGGGVNPLGEEENTTFLSKEEEEKAIEEIKQKIEEWKRQN